MEHSIIDFRLLIVGEKVRCYQERTLNVRFDNQRLATILDLEYHNYEDVLQFYELEAVKKLVDYQFETTKSFFDKVFKFYFFGFVVPALVAFNIDFPAL